MAAHGEWPLITGGRHNSCDCIYRDKFRLMLNISWQYMKIVCMHCVPVIIYKLISLKRKLEEIISLWLNVKKINRIHEIPMTGSCRYLVLMYVTNFVLFALRWWIINQGNYAYILYNSYDQRTAHYL